MIYSVHNWLLSIKNIRTKWVMMKMLSDKGVLDEKWGILYMHGKFQIVNIY